MRLNRFLARCGVTSRRKCDEIIRSGRVKINGVIADEPGISVDKILDKVTVNNNTVRLPEHHFYIVLNKPRGVLTTARDTHNRPTVYSVIGKGIPGLVNVGRLDRDSEGLLLFTTDGKLTYRLAHPKWEVKKVYRVTVNGKVTEEAIRRLSGGIELEDGFTREAAVSITGKEKGGLTILDIEIHEGKKHIVRRMMSAVGLEVHVLRRIRYGPLELGDLEPSQWRELTSDEIEALKKAVGLGEQADDTAQAK